MKRPSRRRRIPRPRRARKHLAKRAKAARVEEQPQFKPLCEPPPPATVAPECFGERVADLVEDFLDEVQPAQSDLCREVLSVALQLARAHAPRTPARTWLRFAAPEVYIRVITRGSGSGHTYQLLMRFFRWLGTSARFPWPDACLLMAECELARRCCAGLVPRTLRFPAVHGYTHAEASIWVAHAQAQAEFEDFASTLIDLGNRDRDTALSAAKMVTTWAAVQLGVPLTWSAFEPQAYAQALLEAGRPSAEANPYPGPREATPDADHPASAAPAELQEFNGQLLAHTARFLDFVGAKADLVFELNQLAVCMAAPAPVHAA